MTTRSKRTAATPAVPDPKPIEQKTPPTTDREPTAKELAAMKKVVARGGETQTVKLKASGKDSRTFEIDYDDKVIGLALLMDAVGTTDSDFLQGLTSQLVNLNSKNGEFDQSGLNFMLSVIKGVEPSDQLEAMLAAQMAAVHTAAMTVGRRLACSENVVEQDSAERAFNKLTRTFANQMESLKRYRTGGPHTVQNVSVADGGQAVVANITHPPSEAMPSKAAAPATASSKTNVVPLPRRKRN